MLNRKKADSDGCLKTMAASSSDAATPPKRKKTQAQKEKHRVNCKNYRLRKKDNMVLLKKNYDNVVAELKKMKEHERTRSELQVSNQEKISKLESDVLALRSVIQQQQEEIERLKQSPSEWPFEELRERGIQSAGEVQDFLIQESDNYKQDVHDPGNELWNWTATGLMTDGEHDDNLCLTQSDLDLIYGSTTMTTPPLA